MRENVIEAYLVKKVEAMGGWAIKFTSSNNAGLPDRICLFPNGSTWYVELKAPGKRPRLLQLRQHKRLRDLGQNVIVLSTIQRVNLFMAQRIKENEQ